MRERSQRTIKRPVELQGIGFLTGADITLRFLPADEHSGIAFQRLDCPGTEPVPALLDFARPTNRRTVIENRGVRVELIEHVMAALTGLQIDNCLVQLNAAEPPGCDGSSLAFAETLLDAGIDEQSAVRKMITVQKELTACGEDGQSEIHATKNSSQTLKITYHLDYGENSPIPAQECTVEFRPESFLEDLAFARTFVLETEVAALKAQGFGKRTTTSDLLVFGEQGVIENKMHTNDECARHKALDCLGDFALLGCDLFGHFIAKKSGHKLNQEIMRRVRLAHPISDGLAEIKAA